MGTNSMWECVSADSIINEIRLTLSYQHNKSFIIVEGNSDVDFFNNYVNSNVIIRQSPSGKLGVYDIVSFYLNNPSVIGICDSDYDESEPIDGIFYYDYSCLEMMILSNSDVCSKLFFQLHLPTETTRMDLLSQLSWLSSLRMANSIHEWRVRFEGRSLAKAFGTDGAFSNELLRENLRTINGRSELITDEQAETILSYLDALHTEEHLLAVTNGHDYLDLIQCHHALHAKKRKRKVCNSDTIRMVLYAHYTSTLSNFYSTSLYRRILDYSQRNSVVFFPQDESLLQPVS